MLRYSTRGAPWKSACRPCPAPRAHSSSSCSDRYAPHLCRRLRLRFASSRASGSSFVQGYFSSARRVARVRSSAVLGPPSRLNSRNARRVTIRKLCALPSKLSRRRRYAGGRARSRSTSVCGSSSRCSSRSPMWPNGGCPRSWARHAALTTRESIPPKRSTVPATARSASASSRTRWAMRMPTCATLSECVSRLWKRARSPGGSTWVTPPSRRKDVAYMMRSQSTPKADLESCPATARAQKRAARSGRPSAGQSAGPSACRSGCPSAGRDACPFAGRPVCPCGCSPV